MSGIPVAAFDFYEDLEADNTKTFWTARKHVYEESVRAPLEALAAVLEPEFGEPKMFRPYRDVRYAKDKTPYKTQQGIWFGESSRYVQVSAAGLLVAGGYYDTSPAQVDRLRRAVADDRHGAALQDALARVRKARFEIGGHQLTRVPRGYPRDHQRADLLRYRTLSAHRDLGVPAWLQTPQAGGRIATTLRSLEPLVEWLDLRVGREPE